MDGLDRRQIFSDSHYHTATILSYNLLSGSMVGMLTHDAHQYIHVIFSASTVTEGNAKPLGKEIKLMTRRTLDSFIQRLESKGDCL